MSERITAARNFCLGWMMVEEGTTIVTIRSLFTDVTPGSFPLESTEEKLMRALDSYFMYCSLELSSESMAVVAATLANGGVCPLTGDRVFQPKTVRAMLSVSW